MYYHIIFCKLVFNLIFGWNSFLCHIESEIAAFWYNIKAHMFVFIIRNKLYKMSVSMYRVCHCKLFWRWPTLSVQIHKCPNISDYRRCISFEASVSKISESTEILRASLKTYPETEMKLVNFQCSKHRLQTLQNEHARELWFHWAILTQRLRHSAESQTLQAFLSAWRASLEEISLDFTYPSNLQLLFWRFVLNFNPL